MALLAIFKVDSANVTVKAVLVAVASVVGLALLLNCRTWWQVADSVLRSQRRRLHSAANSMHKLKSEGFMKVCTSLKCTFIGNCLALNGQNSCIYASLTNLLLKEVGLTFPESSAAKSKSPFSMVELFEITFCSLTSCQWKEKMKHIVLIASTYEEIKKMLEMLIRFL